jgi:hypothetical protein
MRILACLACITAMTSASVAASEGEPSAMHLRGYYRIYDWYTVWQFSDASPWYVIKGASWADPRLVKWGYVPVAHDSEHYYCLIDHEPRTGSNILEWIFSCGDPATVEQLYNANRRPVGLLYGPP